MRAARQPAVWVVLTAVVLLAAVGAVWAATAPQPARCLHLSAEGRPYVSCGPP